MRNILIAALCSLVMSGCYRHIDCTDSSVHMTFVSYRVSETDTIVLRKFASGTNFQQKVDSLIIDSLSASYIRVKDSTTIYLRRRDREIRPGHDWQIYLPATGRTFRVTAIIAEKATKKCPKLDARCFCANRILSLVKDDENIVYTSDPLYSINPYYLVYLKP